MKLVVSVCIPVYNVSKYIDRFLESLFRQTIIEKTEVIFVNDCTKDDSFIKIKNYIEENHISKEKLKLITHETNKGLAAARNSGLMAATCDYIVFCDSDDWLESNYLEFLYNEAIRTNADIVGCNCFIENDYTERRVCNLGPNGFENIKSLLSTKSTGWIWTKLFKKELFDKNNIKWIDGINMFEDVLIDTKLFYYSKTISHVDNYLYHYNNLNDTSLTHTMSSNNANQLIDAMKNIDEFLFSKNTTFVRLTKPMKAFVKNWILRDIKIELYKEYCKLYPGISFYYPNKRLKSIFSILELFCCDLNLCLLALFFNRTNKNFIHIKNWLRTKIR